MLQAAREGHCCCRARTVAWHLENGHLGAVSRRVCIAIVPYIWVRSCRVNCRCSAQVGPTAFVFTQSTLVLVAFLSTSSSHQFGAGPRLYALSQTYWCFFSGLSGSRGRRSKKPPGLRPAIFVCKLCALAGLECRCACCAQSASLCC
jgi:hypothetical protein